MHCCQRLLSAASVGFEAWLAALPAVVIGALIEGAVVVCAAADTAQAKSKTRSTPELIEVMPISMDLKQGRFEEEKRSRRKGELSPRATG